MKKWFYYLPMVGSLVFILSRFLPRAEEVGHDYSHYFARIYFGADHFWKNGFQTPHYTPYLCGGMPFYADPQAVYHSLQQFLAFFIPPLEATYSTFAVFYLLGYWGFLNLGIKVFRFSNFASHFMSFLFLLNGFTFVHLSVGHITHYQFLLAPWILYSLFAFRQRALRISVLTLALSYTLYSGGLHVLLVFAGMIWVALPFLVYRTLGAQKVRELAEVLGGSLLGLLLITSGKLWAAHLFSPYFQRSGIDLSPVPAWHLVLQYFWFNPFVLEAYLPFGQLAFGPWEFIAFVSKVTLPVLFLGLIWKLKKVSLGERVVTGLTLLCASYLMLLAVGKGGNESLPFFSGYHNPLKLLSGLTPLILLFTGAVIDWAQNWKWVKYRPDAWKALVGGLLYLGVFSEYVFYSSLLLSHPGTLGVKVHPELYANVKGHGGLPAVREISTNRSDLAAAVNASSSMNCYEPLFGYRLEKMAESKIQPGSVGIVTEGKWNFHDPRCFLYPEEFSCKEKWQRISVNESKGFQRFLAGYAVDEWVPGWQRVLDRLNTFFALVFCLPLLWFGIGRVVSLLKKER